MSQVIIPVWCSALVCMKWEIKNCYPQIVDILLVMPLLQQLISQILCLCMSMPIAQAKSVRWSALITPESVALKSSASSLVPAGLGSSGSLALITECVHWQTGSSTPPTPCPPLPGQHNPSSQRQIPLSRMKHWEMGQKFAEMIWNGNPDKGPSGELTSMPRWGGRRG